MIFVHSTLIYKIKRHYNIASKVFVVDESIV